MGFMSRGVRQQPLVYDTASLVQSVGRHLTHCVGAYGPKG